MGFWGQDSVEIAKSLKKWKPSKNFKSEKVFEKNLYEYLHDEFEDETFYRQYAKGKTRADIYVKMGNNVPVVIELKYAMIKRDEYHRLVGQIYEYITEWEAEVVVVLCGDCERSFPKLIKNAVEFFRDSTGKKIHFVHKRL